MARIEAERYAPVAQALHWLTAALVVAAVVLAWVFMSEADSAADRFANITLHKSLGQTIFFLVLLRLAWRAWRPPPAMPGRVPRWQGVLARCNHWLLYATLLVMPVSGYVLATAAARPSPYFWLFYWPQPALGPAMTRPALQVHLVSQYILYVLVGLHLLAVLWHLVVRKDGAFNRMLPRQAGE